MACLFHDVTRKATSTCKLAENRVQGMAYDFMIFADDNILLSENSEILEKLLHLVQEFGEQLGLKLNMVKSIIFRTAHRPILAQSVFLKNAMVKK